MRPFYNPDRLTYTAQFSLLNALYRAWHYLRIFLVPLFEVRVLLSLLSTR